MKRLDPRHPLVFDPDATVAFSTVDVAQSGKTLPRFGIFGEELAARKAYSRIMTSCWALAARNAVMTLLVASRRSSPLGGFSVMGS